MDILAEVRAKLEAGKRKFLLQQTEQQQKSVMPAAKEKTPNTYFSPGHNRLVQFMHRESFSGSDIYTTKLHRGILNDWLGLFEMEGSISLPPSSILCIANAALWNSKDRFNRIVSDPRSGVRSEIQLCLVDFIIHEMALPIQDTRREGVLQSQASCIQTVLGDNLEVSVYHKQLDGSVRKIAQGRIASSPGLPVSQIGPTGEAFKTCEIFNHTQYAYLNCSYDIPPSLVEHILQRAVQESTNLRSDYIKVSAVSEFWINNSALSQLWSCCDCRLFFTTVDSATSVSVSVHLNGSSDESVVVMFVQFTASSQGVPVLTSSWQRDTRSLVSLVPVHGNCVLVVADVNESLEFHSSLLDTFRLHFETVDSIVIPIQRPDFNSFENHLSTSENNKHDLIVVILPDLDGDEQVDLASTLLFLQQICQLCARLIIIGTTTVNCSALIEVLTGALLSAQLEYLKCSITFCLVINELAVFTDTRERASFISRVSRTEFSIPVQDQEIEVLYRVDGGENMLAREVRRYHPYNISHVLHDKLPTERDERERTASTRVLYTKQQKLEGVWIVTGGLGGLGLCTAKLLTKMGCAHIILVSRSGSVPYKDQGLETVLSELIANNYGVIIHTVLCDVSDETAVIRMLEASRKFGSIVGIVHAAGVLRDGLIVTGSAVVGAGVVWNSKANGALFLHRHSLRDVDLRAFICFSSVTSALGAVGQAAYAGSNRYLEWLMHKRARTGLPALCIRLPEVSGVGMAAALHQNVAREKLENGKVIARPCSVSTDQVDIILNELLHFHLYCSSGTSTLTLAPTSLLKEYSTLRVGRQFMHVPLTQISDDKSSSVETTHSANSVAGVDKVNPSEETIRASVHRILNTLLDAPGNKEITDEDLLMQAGLDSLGAIELSAQLSTEFNLRVPPTLIFSFPTVNEIIGFLLEEMDLTSVPPNSTQKHPVRGSLLSEPCSNSKLNSELRCFDEVAIVGASLTFPGNCSSLERLWEILMNKECTSTLTPPSRWDVDALLASSGIEDEVCKSRLQSAHFITHEEPFNFLQFNMTAKEAAIIHPSHKLLLINCRRALDDAGFAGDNLCVNTGVYVGIGGVVSGAGTVIPTPEPSHSLTSVNCNKAKIHSKMSAFSATSHSVSVAAGRISFALGLSGPCMAIDTACSSSLVALHAARRALQLNECDVALVCGVNILDPSSTLACAIAGMTSLDGTCRTFDQGAGGYGRSEGCGVVVLQRFRDTQREQKDIYCLVKGSAVKQDGKSASLTAPNGRAQEELLRTALKDACVQPEDVCLLETHGTGTKLGDPVETAAVKAVFSQRSANCAPLLLTAVKANVGHLEAGAGMAGLFSALLAIQHGVAPPNALLQNMSGEIQSALGNSRIIPIKIPTPLVRKTDAPLTAGISSFGYSGTIAHVLLQGPPAGSLQRFLVTPSANVIHSIIPIDSDEGNVSGGSEASEWGSCDDKGGKEQVWQFSGQGDLRIGAGWDLYVSEEVFRNAMNECDAAALPYLEARISDLLYPTGCDAVTSKCMIDHLPPYLQTAQALLAQTANSQIALVALEICLAAVWQAQGLSPGVVLGHSLGEYAAAVVAKVLTIADALKLVCTRGRLVQDCNGCRGVMYAVRATHADVATALQKADATTLSTASLAACNGKMSYVLAGSESAVKRIIALLPPNTGSIKLNVMHAFHSPLMRCVEDEFRHTLEKVNFNPVEKGVKFISAVRGREVASSELADPEYWIDHMLLPVQYVDAVESAWKLGGRTFLEMGPLDTLTKLCNRILAVLAKNDGVEKVCYEAMASL